jgi:N-glycosylase/DNA lyase
MINSRFDYKTDGSGIVVSCPDFSLEETLDCGQAFRFSRDCSGKWTGAAQNKPITLYEKDGSFVFENISEAEFLSFWYDYFDFATDYSEIKKALSADPTMKEAICSGGGIRILRQNGFETLISFIMSQNNNIPRIKGMLSRFTESYGGFPAPEDVVNAAEKITPVRAGFREKYILAAAAAVADGTVDFGFLQNPDSPAEECRKMLTAVSGVGPKVAECVLLFGCGRKECFPVDVWIKRVLERFYPGGFPFIDSPFAGVAQQYLFYWARGRKLI